jgi:hypothetical protein
MRLTRGFRRLVLWCAKIVNVARTSRRPLAACFLREDRTLSNLSRALKSTAGHPSSGRSAEGGWAVLPGRPEETCAPPWRSPRRSRDAAPVSRSQPCAPRRPPLVDRLSGRGALNDVLRQARFVERDCASKALRARCERPTSFLGIPSARLARYELMIGHRMSVARRNDPFRPQRPPHALSSGLPRLR